MAYTAVSTVVTGQTYLASDYNTYVKDNMTALFPFTTVGDIAYAASVSTLARLGKPAQVGLLTNSSVGTPSYTNFPAVGGIPYSSSAAAMSVLAKPTTVGLLTNNSLGAPAYLDFPAAGGIAYSSSTAAMSVLAKPANVGLLLNTSAGALSWLNASATDAYKNIRVNSTGNGFEFAAAGITVDTFGNATAYTYATNTLRDMPNSSKTIAVSVTSTVVVFGAINEYGGDTYGFFEAWLSIDGTVMTYGANRTYGINQITSVPIFGIKTGVTAGTKTIKIREICGAGQYTVNSKYYTILIIPE